MELGQVVKFLNGETCKIVKILVNEGGYQTCGFNGKMLTVQPSATYVLEFEDGETTIASIQDFEIVNA